MSEPNKCLYEEEKKERISIYKQDSSFSFSSDEFEHTIKEEKTTNPIIKEKDKIYNLLKTYYRDRIKLTFDDMKNSLKFSDNKIVNLTEHRISFQNVFSALADQEFPAKIKCSFQDNGDEISFILSKKTNESNNLVEFELPSEISILKRRANIRIKIPKESTVSVGLYFPEKNIELIGNLIDISEVGVGLSFNQYLIDNELISYLNSVVDPNIHFILILDSNNKYINLSISLKHTRQNNDFIEIGAEFNLNDEDDLKTIKELLAYNTELETTERKRNKTLQLIELSKRNIIY